MGAYAGNRLGAIRDAKGKSVAAVFSELGGAQRAEVRRNDPTRLCGVINNPCHPSDVLSVSQILRVLALKVLGAPFT
jgi:hypothetical protein